MAEKDNDNNSTPNNSDSPSQVESNSPQSETSSSSDSSNSVAIIDEIELKPIQADEVLLLEYPGFGSSSEIGPVSVQFGPHRPGENGSSSKPWNYYTTKSDTGFVGLSNQGATCYMNSLLQTLYMTPEFRKALYKWEYVEEIEGPKEDSIPYQLQQLFGNLQLTNRSAVETKGLTKSFGWGMRDAFEQHDIQELNRVLFDALEKSFKGTELSNIINELYQGTMFDRILCKECGHAIERVDQFLDIPLVIRNISSVEEALEKFIEDETLDEDNKFFCEKCEKKCDVLKGLKFQEFPYLLTLQLKRFDIDFESENMDRIKLNNKVTFPRYLDMSKFLFNKPKQQTEETTTVDETSTSSTPTQSQSPTAEQSQTSQPESDAMEIEEEKINSVDFVASVDFDPNSSKYAIQPESNEDDSVIINSNLENNQTNNQVGTTNNEIQLDFNDNEDDDEDMDDEDEFEDDELTTINPENFNTINELMKFLRFYKRNKNKGVNIDLATAAASFLEHYRANSPSSSPSSSSSTVTFSTSSSSSNSSSNSNAFEPEDSIENIPKGDLIYELYSILIHSGSAQGGHYYAYVKSFQTRKWYKFDDSNVSPLKKDDIESSFGGAKNAWGSSTSAYMLVYRKVNSEKNISIVPDEEVTSHLREIILAENSLFEQEKLIEKQKKDKIYVNVFWDQKSKSVLTDRSHTLAELIKAAYDAFELDKREENSPIKLENARVRAYDSHRNIPSDDYGNQLEKTLKEIGINDHTTLLLETREDGEEWPKWSKSETSIHIFTYNQETQEHDTPFIFQFEKSITLREFKVQLCKKISYDYYNPDNIRLFEVTMHISELLGESKKMYSDLRIINGDKLYVEPETRELLPTGEFYSPTKEWFKKTKDTIIVKFNLPGSADFNQSVTIDQKASLREFKQMIEPVIGHASDEFKVKRANITASEYKELDRSLYNLNINGNVLIELGTPLRRDQHIFKLIKYNAESAKFENECDIIVEEGMKVDQLIKNIAEKLNLDQSLIRLRDKIGNRVTKIFKRSLTMKESIPCSYDGRDIVYELVKEYCEIKEDEYLILIARYYPKENKLSEYTEVIIKQEVTLWDFQQVIKGLTDIPIERISITKPFTTFSLASSDTKTLIWKKHQKEEESNQKLTEYRWYINDGDIFFFKDMEEDPPMDDIKHSDKGDSKFSSSSSSSSGIPDDFFKPVVVSRPRREEKALKIKTRFDAAEEKERVEKKKSEEQNNLANAITTNDNNNNNTASESIATDNGTTGDNETKKE